MSLTFVFGATGAGKTEYILQYFLKHAPGNLKKNWFLIVPEQDTLAMQKKITGHILNKGNGILNIDVLSFNRLAYRVFEEQNIRLSDMTVIDDMGKVMILRAVTENMKDKLKLYQRELDKPGFLNELKSQISEFYQYRVTPDMIDTAAAHTDSAYTRSKLHDLALIYQGFQDYMTDHGYLTQEEILDKLYRVMPDSKLLQDSVVAFDGFTGFTPIQLNILEEVLPVTKETLVTCDVSIDPEDSIYDERGPEDLFYLSRQTVKKLTAMAKKLEVEITPAIDVNRYDAGTGEPRDAKKPAYRFDTDHGHAFDVIERKLYRYGNKEEDKTGAGDALVIREAADQRQEIEAIATEIESLIRNGKMRYQDIGIILTEPESYRDIIYKIFSEADIPYFFDDPISLKDSPYAEILCSALLVIDQNFSFDSVTRYLKSLPKDDPDEEHEVDAMDNYLRKTGKRGIGKYSETWLDKEGNADEMEPLRDKLMSPLLKLHKKLRGKDANVSEKILSLKEFMEDIRSKDKVLLLTGKLRALGDQNRAEAIRESIGAIDSVLDQMSKLLGTTYMSSGDFKDILDAGLNQASVRVIPATSDQVVIGDLTRSRFSNPLVFFIAGITADRIPKAESDHKIISDRDRKLFENIGIELAPGRLEDALIQRFYIYRALLNPSERLILSYPTKGRDGKGVKPSGLIGEIKNMFSDLRIEKLRGKKGHIYTKKEAERFVSRELAETVDAEISAGRDYERMLNFLSILKNDEEFREKVAKLISGAFTRYEEAGLKDEVARELYGDMITDSSITRLEKYSQCAYAHFLQYGLRLKERDTFEIQMFDIGNLYHAAIEKSFRDVEAQNRSITDLSNEELYSLTSANVEEVAEAYKYSMLLGTARNRYIIHKAQSIAGTTMWALREQLRHGEFYVADIEKSFEYVRNGLKLKGRIDRIDIAQDEGHVYVKIIDYKTGSTAFDLTKVYNGLQLQLVTYMSYAMTDYQNRFPEKEVLPAAMLYYRIKEPLLDYDPGRTPEDREKQWLNELKLDGLVNPDAGIVKLLDRDMSDKSEVVPVTMKKGVVDTGKKNIASTKQFEALENYVDKLMKQFARDIISGRVAIDPVEIDKDHNACDWCPYHSICKFDKRINGFKYRKQIVKKPEEIWQEIMPEEQQDEVDE